MVWREEPDAREAWVRVRRIPFEKLPALSLMD